MFVYLDSFTWVFNGIISLITEPAGLNTREAELHSNVIYAMCNTMFITTIDTHTAHGP
jgi:hypothetical protein